jgi:hypothetical protein
MITFAEAGKPVMRSERVIRRSREDAIFRLVPR